MRYRNFAVLQISVEFKIYRETYSFIEEINFTKFKKFRNFTNFTKFRHLKNFTIRNITKFRNFKNYIKLEVSEILQNLKFF